MFYAIGLQIYIFSTSCHFNIPSLFFPNGSDFLKTFNNFYSLSMVCFSIFNILFRKKRGFFYEIILNFSICFYVYKTENQFVSISFQFIADIPYSFKQLSWTYR